MTSSILALPRINSFLACIFWICDENSVNNHWNDLVFAEQNLQSLKELSASHTTPSARSLGVHK